MNVVRYYHIVGVRTFMYNRNQLFLGPDSDTKIDSKEHIEPSTASVKDEEVGHCK